MIREFKEAQEKKKNTNIVTKTKNPLNKKAVVVEEPETSPVEADVVEADEEDEEDNEQDEEVQILSVYQD